LSKADDLLKWRQDQETEYYILAERTFSDMNTNKQRSFISLLDRLFGPSPNVSKPPSEWYDKCSTEKKGYACLINPMGEAAVFSLWTQNLQREIIDKPGRGC